MDLVVEELDQLKRKLEITIPEEVVTQRINSAYSELNQQMRMPGFRPGKIPQNILEKQVPVQSFTNMLQALLQEYYEKALRESGLAPAGSPEIDHSKLQDVKKNTPLKFSVTLDVKPEIKIKGYKGLKLKKKETQVGKEELDRAIERILQQYGSFEHHEDGYEAQTGDYLTIDFEGQFEGQPLENGNATDLTVRIGEKKMIKGFEEQLVGHKLDEQFEVKAVLPANWNNKLRRVSTPLPGQEAEDLATFSVKIKELKKLVLPELTDAIAEKEGFETVGQFSRGVKTKMQAMYEEKEEIRIKEGIFDKLVDENSVEVPESMVNNEFKFMIEGMKFQIEQSGMKLEDSGFDEEKAKEEWKDTAEKNCKGYIILESIAQQENMHVSQSDLEEEFKSLAEQSKQKPEDVKNKMMANPEVIKHTTSKILGRKTMDFLYANCEFEFVRESPGE
ncbi:MAG: trigger factor [Nitrospinaceae bacterium]|jgi:trigger factor|nr:trigger factor [Nitrospinaceae bacterium]|tara:strand:- start:109 stop:1449 length:1341 start_codon:yes stop_codon:yes gene_type:complete